MRIYKVYFKYENYTDKRIVCEIVKEVEGRYYKYDDSIIPGFYENKLLNYNMINRAIKKEVILNKF